MKIQQFNSIKKGDRVYLPDTNKKGQVISTEVLEVDRLYKKLKVLLRNKFLSYRYFQFKTDSPISCFVGTATWNVPRSPPF